MATRRPPRKPTAHLTLVEPVTARIPVADLIPETPCLVAIQRAMPRRDDQPTVHHVGGDAYDIHASGWTFHIGPVGRKGPNIVRPVTIKRAAGDPGAWIDVELFAAIVAICGGSVTWSGPPPKWWPPAPNG